MSLAVGLFGLFVVGLGVAGVVSPARLLALVTRMQSRLGLYAIAAIRILLGIALLLAAADSRAPNYLQILGVVALISGIVTPFFGVRRFAAILDWWRAQESGLVRLWSLFVTGFGASMVWAVWPVSPA